MIPSLGEVSSIVSSIEVGVDAQGSGVSVYVGGQPIAEPNERERTNAELVAQRTAERKRRVRELEQAQARAESATRDLLAPVDNRLSRVETQLAPTDAVAKSLAYARRDLEQAAKLTPEIEKTVKALQSELEKTPDNVVAQGASLSLGLNVLNLRISAAHQEAMEGLEKQQDTLKEQQNKLGKQQGELSDAQREISSTQTAIVQQQPEFLAVEGNGSKTGVKGTLTVDGRRASASFRGGYYGRCVLIGSVQATNSFVYFTEGFNGASTRVGGFESHREAIALFFPVGKT